MGVTKFFVKKRGWKRLRFFCLMGQWAAVWPSLMLPFSLFNPQKRVVSPLTSSTSVCGVKKEGFPYCFNKWIGVGLLELDLQSVWCSCRQ
jgi:hypothetical protein